MVRFVRKAFSSARQGVRILDRLLRGIHESLRLTVSIFPSLASLTFPVLGGVLGVVENALKFFSRLGTEALARISLPAQIPWTRGLAPKLGEAYLTPETQAQAISLPILLNFSVTRGSMVEDARRIMPRLRLSIPPLLVPQVSERVEPVVRGLREASEAAVIPEVEWMSSAFQGYMEHMILPLPSLPSHPSVGTVQGAGREGEGKEMEGEKEGMGGMGIGAEAGPHAGAGVKAEAEAEAEAKAKIEVEVEVEAERVPSRLSLGVGSEAARVLGEMQKGVLVYEGLPKSILSMFPQPSFPTMAEVSIAPALSYPLLFPFVPLLTRLSLRGGEPSRTVPEEAFPESQTAIQVLGTTLGIRIRRDLGIAWKPWIFSLGGIPTTPFFQAPLMEPLSILSSPSATRTILEAEGLSKWPFPEAFLGDLAFRKALENLSRVRRFTEEVTKSLLRFYESPWFLGALYSSFPSLLSFPFPVPPPQLPSSSLPLSLEPYLPLSIVSLPSPPAFPAIIGENLELLEALEEALSPMPSLAILLMGFQRFPGIQLPLQTFAPRIEGLFSESLAMPSYAAWMQGPWIPPYTPMPEAFLRGMEPSSTLAGAVAMIPMLPEAAIPSLHFMIQAIHRLRHGFMLIDIFSLASGLVPPEAQAFRLSYNEALARLGIIPIVREPVVARITPPSISYGISRALEPYMGLQGPEPVRARQIPSMPTPTISRLPAPVIQSTIHLEVPTDSEEDMRELERKIARILAEQIRRYYGDIRM